jgi:hypothetical protein
MLAIVEITREINMKLPSGIPLFVITVLLAASASAPASALTLRVLGSGDVRVLQGSVLGKETPAAAAQKKTSAQAKQQITSREEVREVIRRQDNQLIDVAPGRESGTVKVELRKKPSAAQAKPAQQPTFDTVRTETTDAVVLDVTDVSATESAETTRSPKRELLITKKQEKLALQSGSTQAVTSAHFTLDPETGLVTLTTPSGNTHVLKHFPDQAIQVMLAKGKMSVLEAPALEPVTDATESAEATEAAESTVAVTLDAQPELELIEGEDGSMVYRTELKTQKKFLGLLPYSVTQTVELNDATGDVASQTSPNASWWKRALSLLSTN